MSSADEQRAPRSSLGSPQPSGSDAQSINDEVIVAWLEETPEAEPQRRQTEYHQGGPPHFEARPMRRRRLKLPLILFALTCVSTFLAGVTSWNPFAYLALMFTEGLMPLRRTILTHWEEGLLYMGAALAILLAHEMGHFVATLIHRIPASFPFFLPFPISPLGTLGAVIGMEGSRANRKEIFDIGLAGPIAGLVVAIPMFVLGLRQVNLDEYQFGSFQLDIPLAARGFMWLFNTPGYEPGATLWQAQLNPLLMAGWVGMFVTGLNMLPVSQLDGGHLIYTLFRRKAHWIARAFMALAIGYMLLTRNLGLSVMIGLILFIGTDHPPTRDDSVPLGWFRMTLGCLSLAMPVLFFPLRLIIEAGG